MTYLQSKADNWEKRINEQNKEIEGLKEEVNRLRKDKEITKKLLLDVFQSKDLNINAIAKIKEYLTEE